MDPGRYLFGDAVRSTLPMDEWLARTNLGRINPGPDGQRSLRHAKFNIRFTETNAATWYCISEAQTRTMDLSTATKASPLFRLDKKIRTTIFTYAMTYHEPVPIRKHTSLNAWYDDKGETLIREVWRFTPALLRTCLRIHQEASPIFYGSNTFKATIRNSDVSEITSWVQEIDEANLHAVKEFIITIEPTSFADFLDMSTGPAICQQARDLAKVLSKTSISSPQIDLPVLKHLSRDAHLMGFEVDEAEQMRSRWVLELGSAFKKLDEGNDLFKKMKTLMIKAKQKGNKKKLSDA